MSRDGTYSDEELTAYLDGESDYARIAEIDQSLASDPELQARLDRLQIDREELSKSVDSFLFDAPPLPELPLEELNTPQTHNRRGLMKMALAASVAGLVGLGIGSQFQKPALAGWQEYVAAYHALYTRETLAVVAFDETSASKDLARAAATIGKDYEMQVLQESPAMQYRRAQVLAFEGKPILQLSFVMPDGTPIALCITQRAGTPATDVIAARMEGLAAATWSKDGYEHILIGGRDSETIVGAAGFFFENL